MRAPHMHDLEAHIRCKDRGRELLADAPGCRTAVLIIDDERERLLAIIASLERVCAQPRASSCDCCNSDQHSNCIDQAAKFLVEALAFMRARFVNEERLIDQLLLDKLLPADEAKAHKLDHAEIYEAVKSCFKELGRYRPAQLAMVIKAIIAHWTQAHVEDFDVPLSGAARKCGLS